MQTLKSLAIGLGFALACPILPACPEHSRALLNDAKAPPDLLLALQAVRPAQPGQNRLEPERGTARLRVKPEECFLHPNLRSETEIPCLAPLAAAYHALPHKTVKIETIRDGKPARVAVHQIGRGGHERVLVCVHGVMSDHDAFRFVVGALAGEYDFWLVDLPGCGESDAPDPALLGPGGYSPSALADRVLQAVAGCLEQTPTPVRPTLVGHSLGGMVCLRAFADPDLRARRADVLRRINGLVLIAPCDVVIHQAPPAFVQVIALNGATVSVGAALGVVNELMAKASLLGTSDPCCLPREDVDKPVWMLRDPAQRHALQAMLRAAAPFREKDRLPLWGEMKRLEAWYQNVDVPVRIIWGECDQTLSVAMGYKLAKQLPRATLTVLPDSMHSPNLECPAVCARVLREAEVALRDGSRNVAGPENRAGLKETQAGRRTDS